MKIRALLFVLLVCTSSSGVFAQTVTVILTRHAEKAANHPSDPDLSPDGQARAVRFAAFLANQKVDLLYSTPFKRTRQTLEPLAASKNLTVTEYNPAFPKVLTDAIAAMENKTVVIVGHSNSIPDLVNRLAGTAFKQLDEASYGDVFIVTLVAGKPAAVLQLKLP
jgi:broad specificity phosphatase PhoE